MSRTSGPRSVVDYANPWRRRARVARRHLRHALTPRLYPRAPVVPAYWWNETANFGDALTPVLLRDRGIAAVHRPPRRAAVVGVGSIIEHLPPDWAGTIWGSGLMFDRSLRLPNATVVGVRGHLTRERLDAPESAVLGDPGLLIGSLVRPQPSRFRLGLVPHFRHLGHPAFSSLAARSPGTCTVIDVRHRPSHVARRIAQCDAVLTSSLHGLITADALGIPATWTQLEPPLEGRDFKFRDHETVVVPERPRRADPGDLTSVDVVVDRAVRADPTAVGAAVAGLERGVDRLADLLSDFTANPASGPALHFSTVTYGSEGNCWPQG